MNIRQREGGVQVLQTVDVNNQIHAQLVKAGMRLAATPPDDWLNGLIRRMARDDDMRHSQSAGKPRQS